MNYRFAIISSVTLALSTPVFAQDANIDGRVGKLEKEMRAVQRQVFPNGAGKFVEPEIPSQTAPAPTTSSTSATADLTARVDALEAQLATLTGQVELQGNGMRGLEGRLKAIETQMAAQAAPTEAVMPAAAPAAAAVALPKPKPVVATGKPALTAKPNPARIAAVAAVERPATGDVFEDGYTHGYRLWEAKFYPESQAILEETLTKFPKHKRASYARNLLGRAWLDDKKPATAVKVFYDNYKTEPRGDRAPDSLFFLGSALTDLSKTAEACEAFGELERAYPDAVTSRLVERIAAGKTRAKCK
ncbi:tetratricopeptide repeat protein [Sphingorhabdus sp.]|uniref:tetratricopeptide repeat protein n=1 Tax=Sphingorhabdus sp. TaxID=1902408 RepID=UPI003340CA70